MGLLCSVKAPMGYGWKVPGKELHLPSCGLFSEGFGPSYELKRIFFRTKNLRKNFKLIFEDSRPNFLLNIVLKMFFFATQNFAKIPDPRISRNLKK